MTETSPPRVGDRAPPLDLIIGKDASGKAAHFTLHEALSKGPLIVAFIPGAYTNTCHEEMCNFRDTWRSFEALGAQFIAVSTDGPQVQKAWAKELGITLPFGSDLDKVNIRRWGVVWPSWWGTVARRATFVVDPAGTIRFAEVLADADRLPDYDGIRAALSRRGRNVT